MLRYVPRPRPRSGMGDHARRRRGIAAAQIGEDSMQVNASFAQVGALGRRRGLAGPGRPGGVRPGGARHGGRGPEGRRRPPPPVTLRLGRAGRAEEQAFDTRLPPLHAEVPQHQGGARGHHRGHDPGPARDGGEQHPAGQRATPTPGGRSTTTSSWAGPSATSTAMVARDKVDLKGWFPEMVEIMKIDGKLFGLPFKGQVLDRRLLLQRQPLRDARACASPPRTGRWTTCSGPPSS